MHVQPSCENKLLFPPVIKAQRTKPSMNARLAALVKRVPELRAAGLKACHYIEEFHHRRIRPLDHRGKHAYECMRMADPNRKPADGKLPTLSLKHWGYPSFTFFHFVQLCLMKRSMGSWAECSIRTHRPHDQLTCRCPTTVKIILLR
jgi:hypothetical protein